MIWGGIAVQQERADDLGPRVGLGYRADAAAVMAAAPVIQQSRRRGGVGVVAEGRIAVGGEFDFGRATAEVFDGGIDEPETDLSRGARPSPGARVELIGRVIVLVLDLPLVKATVHAAGFLQIH